MGNKICNGQNSELGFSSNIGLQQILSQKENSLSPQIKQFLARQKPYQQQLSLKQLQLKQIGQNLYKGQVDSFGRPDGIGQLYRSDGSLFVGKFLKGCAHGMGYLIFPNGDLYEGFFVDDLPDDPKGKLISQKSAYLGGYKSSELHGDGQFISELSHFKGQFRSGKPHKGSLKWETQKNGFENQYIGEFDQKEKFTGQGELTTKEGVFKGNFLNGKKQGFGRFVYKDGSTYEGMYNEDKKQGSGILKNTKGRVQYEGEWKNNLPNGQGKLFDKHGNFTNGEFINGISSQSLVEV